MYTRQFVLLTATVAALVCFFVFVASPKQVDGDLSDWDVVVSDGNESNIYQLNPSNGLLGYHRDDQSDSAGDGGYLGPHYGGQHYDAEFMGVALQDSMLYVAIVTGQRPDNGLERYSPGDILIVTSNGLFGFEVGGGKGGINGSAISDGADGSTFTLDGNGYTKEYKKADDVQVAGSVWTNVDWISDPFGSLYVQFEITGSSEHVGDADYVYTRDSVTRQHAIIELALDTTMIGDKTIYGMFWAPSCDNDELWVGIDPLSTGEQQVRIEQVPEPTEIALFGLGLSALGVLRRRRRPQ